MIQQRPYSLDFGCHTSGGNLCSFGLIHFGVTSSLSSLLRRSLHRFIFSSLSSSTYLFVSAHLSFCFSVYLHISSSHLVSFDLTNSSSLFICLFSSHQNSLSEFLHLLSLHLTRILSEFLHLLSLHLTRILSEYLHLLSLHLTRILSLNFFIYFLFISLSFSSICPLSATISVRKLTGNFEMTRMCQM